MIYYTCIILYACELRWKSTRNGRKIVSYASDAMSYANTSIADSAGESCSDHIMLFQTRQTVLFFAAFVAFA